MLNSKTKVIPIKHVDNSNLNKLQTLPIKLIPTPPTKPSLRGRSRKSFRAIAWLVETVFRGFAGYIILVDKTPLWATVVVLMTGIYMTASSIGLMAYHFIKAYDE